MKRFLQKQAEQFRLLAMLLTMLCGVFAVSAQNQTATLSHDGELTVFTGMFAFDNALSASTDGDTIYLSEGEFVSSNGVGSHIIITKQINIIGCGYDTHVISDVDIVCNSGDNDSVLLLDGIRFEEFPFTTLQETVIRNCRIKGMYNLVANRRFDLDRCSLDMISTIDGSDQGTVNITNSKIKHIYGESDFYYTKVSISNCNINKAGRLQNEIESSIIREIGWDSRFHTLINCLLPEDYSTRSDILAYDCYFDTPTEGLLDEDLNSTIDLQAKGYLGKDGTVIGAYGGENPFSEYPSVPTIDSERSSVEFDAATNKLNVTITVAPN